VPGLLAAAFAKLPVVSRTSARDLEYLVGGDDLPDLQVRGRIADIVVRVTRLGRLAERRPDPLMAGIPREA
jgi:hypothetical protein